MGPELHVGPQLPLIFAICYLLVTPFSSLGASKVVLQFDWLFSLLLNNLFSLLTIVPFLPFFLALFLLPQ